MHSKSITSSTVLFSFLKKRRKKKKKKLIHLVHVKRKCQFMHGLCYKVTTLRIGSFHWNESTILCTLFLICFARFAKFNVDRVSPKHLQQVKQWLNSQCADFGWTVPKNKVKEGTEINWSQNQETNNTWADHPHYNTYKFTHYLLSTNASINQNCVRYISDKKKNLWTLPIQRKMQQNNCKHDSM